MGRWCDALTGGGLCLAAGILVFSVTCILKDAYLSLLERPRRIMILFVLLSLVNLGLSALMAAHGKLVEDGIVDGWDDPRLVSIAALRRRGYTPESIRMFVELVGVAKANSSVDYAMLEYCIREDLKLKKPRMMAVLDPVKLISEGIGQWRPVATNDTSEGRAQNRRVEMIISGRNLQMEAEGVTTYYTTSYTTTQ